MTKTRDFPYFLPDDEVKATHAFQWGCRKVKKNQRGVVRITIIVPDGVVYRVRWERYFNTDTGPENLALVKAGDYKVYGGKS